MDFICPYKCSYRTSSGYCGSTCGWERCQYRQLHQPNTVVGYVSPLKKTNADRIRAMTDEELAEWIEQLESPKCPCDDWYYNCKKPHCNGCWLDWLKAEVSDGKD